MMPTYGREADARMADRLDQIARALGVTGAATRGAVEVRDAIQGQEAPSDPPPGMMRLGGAPSDFDSALANLQGILIDLDGDGTPDAVMGGGGQAGVPQQRPSRPQMPALQPTGNPLVDVGLQSDGFRGMLERNPRGWGNVPAPDAPTGNPLVDTEARAYRPTLEDRARYGLTDLGMPPEQAGRAASVIPYTPQGIAYEGGQRLAEGDVAGGAGRIALAVAPGAPARALSSAVRYPKAVGAAAGGFGFLGTPGQAGEVESQENIMRMQQTLKEAGYYSGKIDGVMGEGTRLAKEAYQAAEFERMRLETEREKAEAARAETERKDTEAQRSAEARRQGDERLRQVEGEVPWYSQILRDYGPTAGYVAGAIGGGVARKGVSKISDAISRSRATRADQLFAAPATDLPERVGRLNQFWTEGQRGAQAPFAAAPGTRMGFQANKAAPPSSALYQPPRTGNALTDIGMTASFGAEALLGQKVLEPEARAELRSAQEAINADPSEVNIQRLEAAKDRVAMAEFMKNAGRGAAVAYPTAGLKFGRNPTRPNVSAAEAERIRIDQLLGPRAKASPASSTSASSVQPVKPTTRKGAAIDHSWDENAQRWRDTDGQFRSGEPPKN